MKHYELLYLISAQLPENQIEPIQTEVSEWITNLGGTVTKMEPWGRRKLAYPIKQEKYGFYIISEFDLEPEHLKELEKRLRLHKQILRSLTVIKKPLSAKELLAQEQAQKRALARSQEMEETRPETAEPRRVVTEEKEEPKIKLEELDKKLDEILDQDILG